MEKINVVFMGTPDFSLNVLKMLIEKTNVIGVVTQPDKIVGKNSEKSFSPVKKIALGNNIKVIQPEKIRKEYQEVVDLAPDMIVTCAYGQIIPKAILDIPRYGCINVHASLLPKYRGSAPIQWVLLNGEEKTGISVIYMSKGMDEGDILYQKKIEIDDIDTNTTLFNKLSNLALNCLLDFLPDFFVGKFQNIIYLLIVLLLLNLLVI